MTESLQKNTGNNIWELIKVIAPVIIAIVLGYVFGSITAKNEFLTNTQLQNQSYILDVRQTAYSNFFEGQSKLRESERLEALGFSADAVKLRTEYNLAVKTSLFQIVMFGSKQVNESMAEHFRTAFHYGPCDGDLQRWQNEARIYQNMRKEVFGEESEEHIDDETILVLLFRCTLP
ncbi:MAG: hypothetical protein R6V73_12875 [Anaerolineales bacterium]|jgi:hypothetical protein